MNTDDRYWNTVLAYAVFAYFVSCRLCFGLVLYVDLTYLRTISVWGILVLMLAYVGRRLPESRPAALLGLRLLHLKW